MKWQDVQKDKKKKKRNECSICRKL
uniref:Uncharacterized protein n=1 Tax=Rhizophora mucronata TaxID=61149 RepID=A0A2P2N3Q0_RHIMU